MNQIEQGRAYLAAGDYDQAVAAFLAAAREENSIVACAQLGATLALAGRWDELLRVVELGNPQVGLFHQICLALMKRGDYQVLGQLHREIPEHHLVSPLAVYFAGVALIAERRFSEAMAYFVRFKQLVLHNIALFRPHLADSNFNLMFRQGTLVEPPAYVAALDDGSHAVDGRDHRVIVDRAAEAGSALLLFACCLNDLYFLRFAESLVANLSRSCGDVALHFHVYGQQQEFRLHFDALEARYPGIAFGLSREPEPLAPHAPYYAAGRFVVMPKLAELYDRDIITLDADAMVRRDLLALHRKLTSERPAPDFACFDTGRTEPASTYQATLMYFARSPGCRDFLRLLRLFVLSKLDQPAAVSWLLDQASIFSVSLYLETLAGSDFTFRRLDQLTGETLEDLVDHAGTQDEKHALVQAGSSNAAVRPC